MKFKEGITEKNIIIKCGADKFLPFALTFGFYIILFGTISPGGGFQGGVCVASGALLLYLGYGYNIATKAINTEVLRINEAIGASLYVILGLLGIAFGLNFCRNVFYNIGAVGDFISAGTITFMGYAVGYKVLCGVGFLLLLMLGLLAPDPDDADAPAAEAVAAEAPAELPLEETVSAAVETETVKEGVTE